jgi:hypothetical protein
VFYFHYFGLVLGCGGGFQWRSWGCRAWLRGLLLRASLLGARWGGVLSLAKVCRFLPEFCQVVIVVRCVLSRAAAYSVGAVMLVRQRWAVGDLEDWWTRVCGFVPSSIFSGFGS